MGEVWAATDLVTGRAVALKRLLRPIDPESGGLARARFAREAQLACAVEHPNVVEVLDFVESAGEPPVIVMELLEGRTLAARLESDHALSLEETARVLVPVVSAVGTAHARGIIHRDLKPANIFLTAGAGPDPMVKVLDFGIAKWLGPLRSDASLRTQTGSAVGTPNYMAPEQAIGQRQIDHRVDIWSLGIILYEMLAGIRPIEGENAAHMMMRLLSTGIIPVEQLVPTLPADVARLIGKMLSRDPDQRPGDLREVKAVLEPLGPTIAPAFGPPAVDLLSPQPRASDRSNPDLASSRPASSDSRLGGSSTGSGPQPAGLPLRDGGGGRPIRWGRAGAAAVFGGVAVAVASVWLVVPGRTDPTAVGSGAVHGSATPRVPSIASSPSFSEERVAGRVASAEAPPAPVAAGAAVPPVEATPARSATSRSPAAPAHPADSSRAQRSSTARPAAPTASAAPLPNRGLPSGAPCERSRECASGLCVALACE
jgi:serine/threonine protein kinase